MNFFFSSGALLPGLLLPQTHASPSAQPEVLLPGSDPDRPPGQKQRSQPPHMCHHPLMKQVPHPYCPRPFTLGVCDGETWAGFHRGGGGGLWVGRERDGGRIRVSEWEDEYQLSGKITRGGETETGWEDETPGGENCLNGHHRLPVCFVQFLPVLKHVSLD